MSQLYSDRQAKWILALFVLAVVAGTVTGLARGAATSETVTIDDDHQLATDAKIDDYERDGVATARDIGGLDLTITVAEDHEDVGLDGPFTDFDSTYLRFQYNESLAREIRLYVPSDYLYPRVKQDLAAENADVTADFEPAANSSYTAVSLTFDGQADAVFELKKAAGLVFYARESGQSWIENRTGIDLPSIGTDPQWEYIDSSAWVNNSTTARIEDDDPTVQFDGGDNLTETWLPVPECDSSKAQDAPACTFRKDGETNVTYVLARDPASEMPQLRFSTSDSPLTGLGGIVNDLLEMPNRIMKQVQDVLPGGG